MIRLALSLALWSCCALACGTTEARTQIMLEVTADSSLRDQLASLRVAVSTSDDSGATWQERLTREYGMSEVPDWQEFAWPARIAFVPSAGKLSRRVYVRVQGLASDGATLVWQNAMAQFTPHRTGVLRMQLAESCRQSALECGDPDCVSASDCLSCQAGSCEQVKLRVLPDDGSPDNMDAGMSDASEPNGMDSSKPDDAGNSDSAMPEADGGDSGKPNDASSNPSDAGEAGPPPEFRVVSAAPADAAVLSDVNAALKVVFSNPVAGQTVDTDSMQLKRDGVKISGKVTASKTSASFTPDAALVLGGVYELSLSDAVEDAEGHSLTPFTSTFRVRDGQWGSQLVHGDSSEAYSDPVVALSAQGQGVIAWHATSGSTTCWASFFSPPNTISVAAPVWTNCTDVVLGAINDKQHAVMAWVGISGGTNLSMYMAGPSWDYSVNAAMSDADAVILNESDQVTYAVHERDYMNTGAGPRIYGYQYTLSVTTPPRLDIGASEGSNSTETRLALVGDTMWMVWKHTQPAPYTQIFAGHFDNSTGVALSPQNIQASNATFVANAAHSRALAIWLQSPMTGNPSLWGSSIASGGTFSAPAQISSTDIYADVAPVSAAVDDRGRAVVLWQRGEVLYSSTSANGGAWSAPKRVTRAETMAASHPSMRLEPGGNGYAIWTERSGDGVSEVWGARYRADQGFDTPQRISDPEAATGQTVNASIDVFGRVLLAWYANNQVRLAYYQ